MSGSDAGGPVGGPVRRARARNPFATQEPAEPQVVGTGGSGVVAGDGGRASGGGDAAPPVDGGRGGEVAGTPAASFGRSKIQVAEVTVSVAAMAEWDFADLPYEPHPLQVKVQPAEAGQWRATVSWPAWAGQGMAVYRVVAADGSPPLSAADNVEATLTVTTDTFVVDSTALNQPSAGSRYYEVWVYVGPDIATAVQTPPIRHAGGDERDFVLWPPLGLTITAQGSQLVISWDPLEDQRFRLARRTKSEVRRGRPLSSECDDVPPRGHVDPGAVPGEEYVYFLYAGVRGPEQTHWCETPAIQRAALPVRLEAVMDLDAEAVSDSVVQLSWTTVPAGDVAIYFSQEAPAADIHSAGQVAFEELGSYPYHLDLSTPVRNPVIEDSGHSRMLNVDVSSDSSAVFFTPVTRHGKHARPGRSLRWLRADPPTDLILVDRVNQVLVAFRWPRGAARVDLWRTPADAPPPDPARDRQPFASLGREDYDAFGGFLLTRDLRFNSGPCALHLAGYSQHSGSGKHSAMATVRGVFPLLIEYTFDVVTKGGMLGSKEVNRLLVRSAEPLTAGFALIWSHQGFPLSRVDAQDILGTWELTLQARTALAVELARDLPATGFVRLIADPLHEPPIAVIDPPPGFLRRGNG